MSTPHQHSLDAAQANPAAGCGLQSTKGDELANVNSADFVHGSSKISSSATRYTRERDVRNDVRALHRGTFQACVRRALKRMMRRRLPVGVAMRAFRVNFQRRRPGAPHNVAGTMTIRLTVASSVRRATVRAALVLITGARIEAVVDSESINSQIPTRLLDRLAAAVARRAAMT